VRLAVYTDYRYRRRDGELYAERAFALFLFALAEEMQQLVIVGKVTPEPELTHYRIPAALGFCEIPYFESVDRPAAALLAIMRSIRGLWRSLDEVDGVWLLGPHPLGVIFAGLAILRHRSVTLGVRQDFPRYVRMRHPERRWIHVAGDLLEWSWRRLGARFGVVVVGSALAENYRRGRCLEIVVSLVADEDIVGSDAPRPSYGEPELRVLSVGRLEEEKNPLLLADILAQLRRSSPRWRLEVCGEGPLEGALRERLLQLGVAGDARLLGYVSQAGGLRDIYRRAHVLLHVSWTEGVPQVLFEAFAARLPVVATAVGGVAAAVGDAALLIEPGRADVAVAAIERIVDFPELRSALVRSGAEIIAAHTLAAEAHRVATFLHESSGRR
jgi:glycosyltransferase involved in cell wall biosynthesis